jgi:hypothetical protein
MKNNWKWMLGIAALVVLSLLPFAWRSFPPYGRYPMMGQEYGWHMPMMYGGNGMMGSGMLFMWLISPGSLVLIGLGIAWLIRAVTAPENKA